MSDISLLKIREFFERTCAVSEPKAKDALINLVTAAFADSRYKLWQYFGLSWKPEVAAFFSVAFPEVAVLPWEGGESFKSALFGHLEIEFPAPSANGTKPEPLHDEQRKKHAQSYLVNNTPDLRLRPVAKAVSGFFALTEFGDRELDPNSKAWAMDVLALLNPEEFSHLGFSEVSDHVSIHAKMCDYVDENTQKDDREAEIFSRILKNLISNRGYHLWENLGFTGKPDMRGAIRTFYPAWADIIENDTENKLGTCNRQKLSRILDTPTIFRCSHCSSYRAPVLERYVGTPIVARKMEQLFEGAQLPPKLYYVCRTVVLFTLLFPNSVEAIQILGITQEELSHYARVVKVG